MTNDTKVLNLEINNSDSTLSASTLTVNSSASSSSQSSLLSDTFSCLEAASFRDGGQKADTWCKGQAHISHGDPQKDDKDSYPAAEAQRTLDIRRDTSNVSLAQSIRDGLQTEPPRLPSLVLWDTLGLELFQRVIDSPDYYLSHVETDIIRQHAGTIADNIADGSMIIDLGCGSAQKILPILEALSASGRSVDYYALDLSEAEITRSLDSLATSGNFCSANIRCHGLLGTFDDAQSWLQSDENVVRPKCLLSLGSAIGNMTESEAATFVKKFAEVICKAEITNEGAPRGSSNGLESTRQSSFIIGQDSCMNIKRITRAYADSEGHNAAFILNGLKYSNSILGYEAFEPEQWRVVGEWKNQAWNQNLIAKRSVDFEGLHLSQDQKVHVSQSRKFSKADLADLWATAGLTELYAWPCFDGSLGTYKALLTFFRCISSVSSAQSG
ncbi:MAG: hypothetical protein Q9225_003118 [Loekoesia sp. 1 TL-2023]